MTVNYDDSVYSFDTGSSVGLGTQFKEEERLNMAVNFINIEKALGVENRRQMFKQATPVLGELKKLRLKKAKWNTWNANDIIVRGGNEKTKS